MAAHYKLLRDYYYGRKLRFEPGHHTMIEGQRFIPNGAGETEYVYDGSEEMDDWLTAGRLFDVWHEGQRRTAYTAQSFEERYHPTESKLEARDRDIDNMSRALNAMRFEVERCQQALGQAQREAASMRATNAALLADNDRLYALVQSCPVEFEPEEGETGYEP